WTVLPNVYCETRADDGVPKLGAIVFSGSSIAANTSIVCRRMSPGVPSDKYGEKRSDRCVIELVLVSKQLEPVQPGGNGFGSGTPLGHVQVRARLPIAWRTSTNWFTLSQEACWH